jgi:uncharacterized surface protein with fasciclin (FAS1) repeats
MRKKYIHIPGRFFLMIVIVIITCLQYSCNLNSGWDDYYKNPPDRSNDNLLTLIGENENYSRFYNALLEYGYEDLLSKNQYLTIFVPPNSAFEGIPEYSPDEWNKIIGFHILYANLYSRDFKDLDLLTIIGKYLNMRQTAENEFKIFESAINMNNVDEYCQNGVIHEIDQLLIPKPNVYEYILSLDSSYSILQDFLLSMDTKYIDYEKSERIGVNDNGDPIYDTVWRTENYYLDNIAGLDEESEAYTGFIPSNDDVTAALNSISDYFGDYSEMDDETYNQMLFIAFSGSFMTDAVTSENLPDTIVSVTDKSYPSTMLNFEQVDLEMSNGMIHMLSDMTIPKSFFLLPITVECDQKENRTVSNTIYPVEQKSDSRATNGSYVWYGCQFVDEYLEFTVNMVLKTTYWFTWTGPKQGAAFYQLFVKDESTGEFINIGEPVNNWTKIAWKPVVSGTYGFEAFGTKTIRFKVVDDYVAGSFAIFVDYIKLTPDEIYVPE